MHQSDTPPHDSHQPDSPKRVPLSAGKRPNPQAGEFTHARIALFISLLIIILLFSSGNIIVSLVTAVLLLMSTNFFDPVFHGMLKHLDKLLLFLYKPLVWLLQLFFVKHRTSLSRYIRHHRRRIIDIIAILALIILLGTTTLRPFVTAATSSLNDSICLHTHLPWFTCNSGFGVTTLPNDVRIGLIADNSFGPFDQTPFNQDEQNIEKLIFAENQYACSGRHITLAVVTLLSRTIEDPQRSATLGLENLQGSYLEQREFNKTHAATRICLVIANLGTADTSTSNSPLVRSYPGDYSLEQVIHQLTQLARTDPSFRGIVGFPYSQQVDEALKLIKESYPSLATIPIISPSTSSDKFSNTPNFYRIVSPDTSQGKVMAQFFCDNLIQSQPSGVLALLTDSSNAYSNSLNLAFNDALRCVDATHRVTLDYTNGDTTSIQNAIQSAVGTDKATYIFFPGYEQDMDTVEQKIHDLLQARANTVTIIAGDAINNVTSTTHYSYTRIYATSFTRPFSQTDPRISPFVQQHFFKPLPAGSSLWFPTDMLLAFDAVNAFGQTVDKIQPGFTQDDFNNALATIDVPLSMSGPLSFQGDRNNKHSSDRDEGYVSITCNDFNHTNHLLAAYSIINNGISLPQNLHLTQKDGVSSCP